MGKRTELEHIFQQLDFTLLKMDWALLFLPLPFFTGMLIDASAWKALLPRQPKITFASLIGPQLGAEAVLLSLPGGFAMTDAIKLFLLKKRSGVPSSSVLASLIMRHWTLGITQMMFIAGACLAGTIFSESDVMSRYLHDGTFVAALLGLLLVSVILGVVITKLFRGRLARSLWLFLYRIPIPAIKRRVRPLASSFKQTDLHFAQAGQSNRRRLAVAFLLYMSLWFMDVCETLLVAHAIGFQISFVNAFTTEAVLSAARLAAFFLPGGLVVKEVGYFALFSSMHIAASTAQIAAFIVVKRMVSLFCIACGYVALLLQGVRWKNRSIVSYKTAWEHS